MFPIINTLGVGTTIKKGIAEVNFGSNAKQSDIAYVTVFSDDISSTSYPNVSMYALDTSDHTSDEYASESLIPYVANIIDGVSFDIIVRAPMLTRGKYKVTYSF